MLRTLFISLLCLLGTTRALAWGQKGHDVVAYIAECNLTPEAAEKIDKILGGASMVFAVTAGSERGFFHGFYDLLYDVKLMIISGLWKKRAWFIAS